MDNKKEILYPVGTLVRYKSVPKDAGYVHNIYEAESILPRVYVIRMFNDGALMHCTEQNIEAIPVQSE